MTSFGSGDGLIGTLKKPNQELSFGNAGCHPQPKVIAAPTHVLVVENMVYKYLY